MEGGEWGTSQVGVWPLNGVISLDQKAEPQSEPTLSVESQTGRARQGGGWTMFAFAAFVDMLQCLAELVMTL